MIQVDGLTKYYGEHAAINNLTFGIERGQVIGFLGLNGAGKSTTLKVLGCILLPTSGRVTIDGFDVAQNPHEIRKRIGYLPDTPPVYDEMSVGDYLSFVAQLRGVDASSARSRVEEVEEQTSLRDMDEELIGRLSHGYRQRVGVAQAMVHKPKLLILDEPTGGLDPVQIVEMRSLIKRLRGEHTVLVSSHILSEISQVCDRLLVIQAGKIEAQGTEEELARKLGGGESNIEIEVAASAAKAKDALAPVKGIASITVMSEKNGVTSLRISVATEARADVARALVGAGIDLLRLDKSAAKLESIFLRLTHGKEVAS